MRNALVLLLAIACSSCSALGLAAGAAGDPVPQLVLASRAAHDVVAPRWRSYVERDEALAPLLREQLLALVEDWRLAIERAEAFLAPAPTAPPTGAPAAPPGR